MTMFNVGQSNVDKFTKSNVGISREYFMAFFCNFGGTAVKVCLLGGRQITCQSIPNILVIRLKFPDFLKSELFGNSWGSLFIQPMETIIYFLFTCGTRKLR